MVSPVSLNVEVKEGTRYRVEDIQIKGYRTVSPEEIMALSQIQPGDFFDRHMMRKSAEAVRKLYAARGYLNASIVPSVEFLGGRGVSVSFNIIEGPQSP